MLMYLLFLEIYVRDERFVVPWEIHHGESDPRKDKKRRYDNNIDPELFEK